MTKYYPIMLDIREKHCTVVGGGGVAERKVKSLLEHGAKVTVISPESTKKLEKMNEEKAIKLLKRQYKEGDLRRSFLVYVATDDPRVSEVCRREAQDLNIMINVVDVPHLCDFIVPAIHRQGSLTIAVSTDGKSPMFSRKIREELQEVYGPKYDFVLGIMGEIRERALKEIQDIEVRKELFHQLTYGNSIEEISDLKVAEENMWKIYELFRNREGCDDNEKNKNWV